MAMAAVPAVEAIGARGATAAATKAGSTRATAGTATKTKTANRAEPRPPAGQHAARLRGQGQTPDQVRKSLTDMGYSGDQVNTIAPPASPSPAAEPSPPTRTAPTRSGPQRGGGSGLLLGIVLYPITLAFLRDGVPGMKAWFAAKFLNKVSASSVAKPASAVNSGVISV